MNEEKINAIDSILDGHLKELNSGFESENQDSIFKSYSKRIERKVN